MDENAPVTRSTPAGNPVQDNVDDVKEPATDWLAAEDPAVREPEAGERGVEEPAVREPEAGEPAVRAVRPKGPNASAVVLGLVAIVFAGLVIAKETMGLHVDWSRLGPGGIVGIGVVMVVLGAIGLIRRRDDA
jgi:hypothetical protein